MGYLNTDVVGNKGELLTIQSPVESPVSSLIVHISPKQAGEGAPSSENVRPIRGWEGVTVNRCGKNLYTIDKVRAHGHDDWDTIMSGAKGKSSTKNFNRWTFVDVAIPNEKYTFIPNCYEVGFLDEDTNVIKYYMGWNHYVITAPEKARYIYLTWYKNGVNTAEAALEWHNRMFLTFSGSAADEESYEPYRGQFISVNWTDSAGIVYGGYVDLLNGEVVEEYRIATPENIAVRMRAATAVIFNSGKAIRCYVADQDAPCIKSVNWTVECTHMSDCGPVSNWSMDASSKDGFVAEAQGNSIMFIASELGFTTKEEWAQWVIDNEVKHIYPLATPIHHPIPASTLITLRGINYIWTDGDSVDVSYRCAETRDMIQTRRQTILAQPSVSNWIVGTPIAHYEGDMLTTMKNCRAYFTPTQDLNGYDKPWPGGGGKNLFNAESPIEINAWMNGPSIRGSSTDRVIYIPCKPNTTYTVSKSIGDVLAAGYTDQMPEIGLDCTGSLRDTRARTVTLTTDDSAAFLAVWCYDATKTTDKDLLPEDIYAVLQIEVGEVATEWTPYENTCVIHGWEEITVHSTGKNIFPNENGKSAPLNLKAGTVITASTSAISGGYFRGQNKDGEHVTPIVWLNQTDEAGRKVMAPYTIPEDISTGFIFLAAGVSEAQITLDGSTAYEEYAGQTTTVKFPDTFYGGYVDLAKGVLVQEWNKLIADGVNLKCTPNYTYTSGDMFGGAIVYLTPEGVSDRTNIGENYVYCDKLPKNQPASEKPYIGTEPVKKSL